MLLLLLLSTCFYRYAECRVHCEDRHALPFKYNGFSCPVNCNNVIHAVETLKLMDVENIVTPDKQEEVDKLSEMNTKKVSRAGDSPTHHLYSVCDRILENKMVLQEVQTKLGNFRNICGVARITVRRICSRKSRDFEAEFISYFTKLLNTYVIGRIKFTEDLTSLILERFLESSELRQGMIDVQKLLQFLKRTLLKHRIRGNPARITLKSSHCMTIYVPGCYCLTGFVESEGQCVTPVDCFSDNLREEYLTRIIIA